MIKYEQCKGNGTGSCKRCLDNGKWNCFWMSWLYKIDGYDGYYCWDCLGAIVNELEKKKNGC